MFKSQINQIKLIYMGCLALSRCSTDAVFPSSYETCAQMAQPLCGQYGICYQMELEEELFKTKTIANTIF